jgi:hypothetical protein
MLSCSLLDSYHSLEEQRQTVDGGEQKGNYDDDDVADVPRHFCHATRYVSHILCFSFLTNKIFSFFFSFLPLTGTTMTDRRQWRMTGQQRTTIVKWFLSRDSTFLHILRFFSTNKIFSLFYIGSYHSLA